MYFLLKLGRKGNSYCFVHPGITTILSTKINCLEFVYLSIKRKTFRDVYGLLIIELTVMLLLLYLISFPLF